jgi:hypothetical protein
MSSNPFVRLFFDFINDYNSIGYGEARVFETKRNYTIHLWNAGFSENEELETRFINEHETAKNFLVYDYHPIKIFVIHKLSLFSRYTPQDLEILRTTQHYERKRKFIHKIEVD